MAEVASPQQNELITQQPLIDKSLLSKAQIAIIEGERSKGGTTIGS